MGFISLSIISRQKWYFTKAQLCLIWSIIALHWLILSQAPHKSAIVSATEMMLHFKSAFLVLLNYVNTN